MALIDLKNLLNHAKANSYIVGAFNITNLNFIGHLINAAGEEKSPIILQTSEANFKYLNLEEIVPVIINASKKRIKTLAPNSGYICSPTNHIKQDVPIKNFLSYNINNAK